MKYFLPLIFTFILLFSALTPHNAFADKIITTIPIQGVPVGLGVNPTTHMIYVGTSYDPSHSDQVYVINGATNNVTSIIQGGPGHRDIDVNPNTDMIYVVNFGYYSTSYRLVCGNTISVINGTTNSIQNTIQVGNCPIAIGVNPNTNMIYVANSNDNTVSVINGATNSVQSTIQVGNSPNGVGVNPNINMIYVANSNDNTVSVINGATNSVQSTIQVGNSPNGVGVNPNINMIYVANSNDNTVSVINGATNSVQSTIQVGNVPFAVVVNPNTGKVYVGNAVDNTVSVINGATNSVQSAIQVNNPWDIGVDSDTNMIYVVNNAGRTVSVIDGSPTQTPTSNVVTAFSNKTIPENPFTLVATVLPSSSTGTIQFQVDGINLESPVTLSGGTASLTTSLPTGTHDITASYSGDSNFAPSTSAQFTITVQTPALATQNMIIIINNMTLTQGTTNSLVSKLDTSISYMNSNDSPNAKSTLQSFINEVNAQAGKKLTTDQANQLTTAAQNVMKSIS